MILFCRFRFNALLTKTIKQLFTYNLNKCKKKKTSNVIILIFHFQLLKAWKNLSIIFYANFPSQVYTYSPQLLTVLNCTLRWSCLYWINLIVYLIIVVKSVYGLYKCSTSFYLSRLSLRLSRPASSSFLLIQKKSHMSDFKSH